MAQQQDRKERNQGQDSNQGHQNLQTTRGRNEMAWRDPFSAFWSDPFSFLQRDLRPFQRESWPQVETFQRGDQFIVRADLPGLNKEDVNVEVTDDAVTIQGERREEREENREGYYRSERSYGSFYRVVPLPEGVITESAKANFKNGVLEITVQAPPHEVSRRRRVEIGDSTERSSNEKERGR